jgi:hypothetical protein
MEGESCRISVQPFTVRDNAVSYGIGGTGLGSGAGTVILQTTDDSDINFSIDLMPPTGSSYVPYGTWTSTHQASQLIAGIDPTTHVIFEIRAIDNAGKSGGLGASFTGCS